MWAGVVFISAQSCRCSQWIKWQRIKVRYSKLWVRPTKYSLISARIKARERVMNLHTKEQNLLWHFSANNECQDDYCQQERITATGKEGGAVCIVWAACLKRWALWVCVFSPDHTCRSAEALKYKASPRHAFFIWFFSFKFLELLRFLINLYYLFVLRKFILLFRKDTLNCALRRHL